MPLIDYQNTHLAAETLIRELNPTLVATEKNKITLVFGESVDKWRNSYGK